ncbi:hypothetical protein MQE36_06100 [Zhouia spongiae]|uniref:Linear amide C-N hydrolase n=1 Tax=Zhouia spongiae TaxID=2202721 RepID=A0ABY3YTC1_9FLAO|nr:hypothetical protein [Zhouia spongiae]UNY99918.1 hypothetical protein MQE36_06100 [Zhouia spongiae]
MKYLPILIAVILFYPDSASACSMYKITKNGKTIVGNNEDWFSPNTQIWFVPKGDNPYGVMNVGFENGFPQGAINEAGLVYDGFAMPYLEIKNTDGKKEIPITELIPFIMHKYANVKEIKEYLSTVNLSYLSSSMLVFIDRSGEYLIVEGDELIIGNEAEKSFSNFYPSQNSNPEEVNIPFYQNGLKHLKTSESKANLDYCSSVMNKFQQTITQYTTIYDLEERKIRLYHYQNFDNYIELDLIEELNKGEHQLKIPELFPKNTKGYQYYIMYNDADAVVEHYETRWENESINIDVEAKNLLKKRITQSIAYIATDWAYTKKDDEGAIKIYKLILKLFPENQEAKKTLENFIETKKKQ